MKTKAMMAGKFTSFLLMLFILNSTILNAQDVTPTPIITAIPQAIPSESTHETIVSEVKLKIAPENKDQVKELLQIEGVRQMLGAYMKEKGLADEVFWQHFILTPTGKEFSTFLEIQAVTAPSRAANDPDLYFTSLTAKLDKEAFLKIYQQNTEIKATAASLFLRIEYDLAGVTWQEFGVTYQEDFTKVVEDSWRKWLRELDPRLKDLQVTNSVQTSGQEIFVKLRIEKQALDSLRTGLNLHFTGGVFMKNLQTGNILFAQKIDDQDEFYPDSLGKGLSSAIANFAYRFPLSALSKVKTQNFSVSQDLGQEMLSLSQFKTSEQVFHFMDMLKEKGAELNLVTKLKGIAEQKAMIEVQFKGNTADLKKFLQTNEFEGVKRGSLDLEFISLPINTVKELPKNNSSNQSKEEARL